MSCNGLRKTIFAWYFNLTQKSRFGYNEMSNNARRLDFSKNGLNMTIFASFLELTHQRSFRCYEIFSQTERADFSELDDFRLIAQIDSETQF